MGSSLARGKNFICGEAFRLACGRSVVLPSCPSVQIRRISGVFVHLTLAGRRAMTAILSKWRKTQHKQTKLYTFELSVAKLMLHTDAFISFVKIRCFGSTCTTWSQLISTDLILKQMTYRTKIKLWHDFLKTYGSHEKGHSDISTREANCHKIRPRNCLCSTSNLDN